MVVDGSTTVGGDEAGADNGDGTDEDGKALGMLLSGLLTVPPQATRRTPNAAARKTATGEWTSNLNSYR